MLEDLKTGNKISGVRQVTRALKNDALQKVFWASDADPRVTEPIVALCAERNTEMEEVSTMTELGLACGIAVGSAVAAIVKSLP